MLTTANESYRVPFTKNKWLFLFTVLLTVSWVVMFLYCIDVQDWFIENILVFLFVLFTLFTINKFQFSDVSYGFIFLFLMLHLFGAMYAYTQNPLGEYLQNKYLLWRNPYDRIVHFSFGLCLAYPLYDYLTNRAAVKGKWRYILPVEITLSLATIFELIEWTVAELTTKETGETYVATQGDPWDAHKDIVLAVLGAAITMAVVYITKKKTSTT